MHNARVPDESLITTRLNILMTKQVQSSLLPSVPNGETPLARRIVIPVPQGEDGKPTLVEYSGFGDGSRVFGTRGVKISHDGRITIEDDSELNPTQDDLFQLTPAV